MFIIICAGGAMSFMALASASFIGFGGIDLPRLATFIDTQGVQVITIVLESCNDASDALKIMIKGDFLGTLLTSSKSACTISCGPPSRLCCLDLLRLRCLLSL